MTNKMASLMVVFAWIFAGFLQSIAQVENDPVRTFTKKDGAKVEGKIQKYSTSTKRVRVRTEEGETVELPFNEISSENQKILTEWKMNEIVQSSNFAVSYKRVREKTGEHYKRGTDLKVVERPVRHELTLENKERIPITGLTILYAVAYEKSSVLGQGVRSTDGDGLGFYFEELPVMDIQPRERVVVETPTFTLKTYTDVSSGDHWGRGSEAGGEVIEKFRGVVFRLLRNGEVLREEASPPSLAKRNFAIRPSNAPPKPAE